MLCDSGLGAFSLSFCSLNPSYPRHVVDGLLVDSERHLKALVSDCRLKPDSLTSKGNAGNHGMRVE